MKALFAATLLLVATPAFAEAPEKPSLASVSPDGSLYRQFGGHDGMVHLTDDLFVNVMADPRINGFFEPAKVPHIKAMLVDLFCQVTGGDCTYAGKDLEKTHDKLGIKPEDFNALVEDLQKAMDKNHIPFAAQNKLLAALAPQSRVMMYKPSADDFATSGNVVTK